MKKTMFIYALILVSLSSFTYASAGIPGNINALASFTRDFKGATNVSWTINQDYIRADFRIKDQYLYAYYATNGDLIATAKFISPTQLPADKKMAVNKKYIGYWISELFELNDGFQNSYYITIENADQKVILKTTETEDWEIYKKEKK